MPLARRCNLDALFDDDLGLGQRNAHEQQKPEQQESPEETAGRSMKHGGKQILIAGVVQPSMALSGDRYRTEAYGAFHCLLELV